MRAAFRRAILIFAIAVWVPCVVGCRAGRFGAAPDARGAVAPAAPVVILHAGARDLPFRVELAASEAQREKGLMYRNHMDPDAGMLFVFERDAPLTFWMKNTLIPLDMIFIGSDRRILGIVENAEPETETPRRVEGLSRYVLEIAGGMSRRLGLAAGSSVEFKGVPRDILEN